jgi:hypothetical protein
VFAVRGASLDVHNSRSSLQVHHPYYDMKTLIQYKAAIALNNMAVSMVDRRSYRDASDTFKDALALIRRINMHEPITWSDSTTKINQCLHKASKRLALPKTPKTNTRNQEFEIRLLSHEQCVEAVDIAISELPSNMTGVVLRIDDCDEYDDEPDVGFATTIILHNLGTMCRWSCCTLKGKSKKYKERIVCACNFLTTAHSLLSDRSETTADVVETLRIAVLTILVLQNLMILSFQLEMRTVGQQCYDKLCCQRDIVLQLESLQPRADFNQTTAAAQA